MKKLLVLVLFLVGTISRLGYGQVPLPTPPPPPGLAPVQRLDYFVGTWNFVREDLTDPKSRFEGTVTWKWFQGEVSIIGWSEGTSAQGAPINELTILGYSPTGQSRIGHLSTKNAYAWYTVGRRGPGREVRRFSADGGVWTCESQSTTPDGRLSTFRHTITAVSPAEYSYTVERSLDGRSWTQTIDLKATKVK
jgi:hypothetical protein